MARWIRVVGWSTVIATAALGAWLRMAGNSCIVDYDDSILTGDLAGGCEGDEVAQAMGLALMIAAVLGLIGMSIASWIGSRRRSEAWWGATVAGATGDLSSPRDLGGAG